MRWLLPLLLLWCAPAAGATQTYALVCSVPCQASDGTTQPVGTILPGSLSKWDGVTPWDIPSGFSVVRYTGQPIYRPPAVLNDTLGSVVNVLERGAACDGLTDDAPAIQAAMGAGGVVLFFPPSPKPCMVGKAIRIPSNTTLQAHPGTVTLKATATNASTPLLLSAETGAPHDIYVHGLTLDGNAGGQIAGALNKKRLNGIVGATRVVFDRVTIQHSLGIGLQFANGTTLSGIQNSAFLDVGMYYAISGNQSDAKQAVVFTTTDPFVDVGNFALGNTFSLIGYDAITFSYQTSFSARGNRCYLGSGGAGLQSPTIQSRAGCACVFGYGGVDVQVSENQSWYASGASFDLSGIVGLTVSGNGSYYSGSHGIILGAGIRYGITTGATGLNAASNMVINPGQINPDSAGIGITNSATGGGPISNGVIAQNVLIDIQSAPTARWGIANINSGAGAAALNNVLVDTTNIINGMPTPLLNISVGRN